MMYICHELFNYHKATEDTVIALGITLYTENYHSINGNLHIEFYENSTVESNPARHHS